MVFRTKPIRATFTDQGDEIKLWLVEGGLVCFNLKRPRPRTAFRLIDNTALAKAHEGQWWGPGVTTAALVRNRAA